MGTPYQHVVLQNAAGANGNGTELEVSNLNDGSGQVLGLQITGTFTATVNFEGTIDGSNWSAVEGVSMADDASTPTTATAAGLYRINTGGLLKFRARISNHSDGTVTVTALLDMVN